MATAGLDLLTSTLMSDSDDFQGFILAFKDEMRHNPPLVDATNVNLPISAPSQQDRVSWHCNDFIRLYRQRAWALFKEISQIPRLPSEDEYRKIFGPGPDDMAAGWMLAYGDTRNELICHSKGFKRYSSLFPKLVPFWNGYEGLM